MAIKSIFKPEGSIMAGLATVSVVYAVYSKSLPDAATMHATAAYDRNLEAGRKKAAWAAVGAVGVVSLLTRDANVFILGGLATIALDWHARHAIMTHPDTGAVVTDTLNVKLQAVS